MVNMRITHLSQELEYLARVATNPYHTNPAWSQYIDKRVKRIETQCQSLERFAANKPDSNVANIVLGYVESIRLELESIVWSLNH